MSANKKAKTEVIDVEADEAGDDVEEQLRVIKEELFKLNEEASDKVLEIEQQYSKKRRPIYDQRNAVLKQIPQFWQTALLKHPVLNPSATEDDVDILGYCTELNVEDYDDIKSGYRIILKFSENPYFSNEELVKSYSYQEGGDLKVGSTVPVWKEGYEPPEDWRTREDPPEDRVKDGKRQRAPDYKLFTWFMTGEEVVASTATDDVAEIIKEEIWPDPMRYYEGELSEEDVEFDEEEAEYDEEGEEQDKVEGEGEEEDGEEEEGEEEEAS